jgi:hypothetical protein
MEFSNPLARGAKICPLKNRDGAEQHLLVILTTLVLDPKSERYRPKMVDRLSRAAEEFIGESPDLAGFALINRFRDW